MFTSPSASASTLFRSCSTGGSPRNFTRTSVPPRKSTPQFNPRVNRATRLNVTATTERPMNRTFFPITSKLALVSSCNCFTPGSPSKGPSDAQGLHPLRPSEDGVEQRPRDEDGGEQIGQNADAQGDRESLDRSGSVAEQEDRGDEGGQVGVDDGAQGLGEPASHRRLHRLSEPQLFPDSLEDQHVGVHRHSDGERDSRDSRERQRGSEITHRSEQEQNIQSESQIRVHPRQPVIDEHEQHHQG